MILKRALFPLLIFALLLLSGLFLWQQNDSVESEMNIPIVLENLSGDLTVSGQAPREVEAVLRGQKIALESYGSRKSACALDLAGAGAGLITLPVGRANFGLPESISLVRVEPSSITLRLEPKLTKTVPVSVALSNDTPATGYRVEFTQAIPATLRISGPEKVIAPMEQLTTLPVSVKDAAESFKKEVAVDLPAEVTIGGNGTPVVTAQVIIKENVTTRRFDNIPVKGRNTILPTKITPPTMSIVAKGPENVLSALSAEEDITAYVDLKDLSPGVYVRRPQITLPVGTTLDGADPEVLTVVIGQ